MDRAYIDSHHLIDRYVQGRLSGADLDEFEIYMLEHPEIVDDIQYAKGMQDSISAAGEELFADSASNRKTSVFGSPYAMAAMVLLTLSLSFSGYQYLQIQELKDVAAATEGLTVISRVYYLEPVRGEADTTIELHEQAATIIHADVGVVEAESWIVELYNDDSGTVMRKEGLRTSGHIVSVVLGEIPVGQYTLRIFAGPGEVLSMAYALEVIESHK